MAIVRLLWYTLQYINKILITIYKWKKHYNIYIYMGKIQFENLNIVKYPMKKKKKWKIFIFKQIGFIHSINRAWFK